VEIIKYCEASKEGIVVETNYRGATKEEHRGGTKVSWRNKKGVAVKTKVSWRNKRKASR
jgi:hypothetical protein